MQAIQQFPELTADDQSGLMGQIAAARDAEQEQREGDPSPTRHEELDRVLQDGATARELLVASHRRLVVSIAARYGPAADVPTMQLVRAGNVGLDRAAERYDPARGFEFRTYATWWVRQEITCRICESSP